MLCRHVSGADLCEGLRELALHRWGMLARTVLTRWNVRRTLDFGRIVFALVDSGWMQSTADDSLEDFREVFDFKSAFDTEYRIAADADRMRVTRVEHRLQRVDRARPDVAEDDPQRAQDQGRSRITAAAAPAHPGSALAAHSRWLHCRVVSRSGYQAPGVLRHFRP